MFMNLFLNFLIEKHLNNFKPYLTQSYLILLDYSDFCIMSQFPHYDTVQLESWLQPLLSHNRTSENLELINLDLAPVWVHPYKPAFTQCHENGITSFTVMAPWLDRLPHCPPINPLCSTWVENSPPTCNVLVDSPPQVLSHRSLIQGKKPIRTYRHIDTHNNTYICTYERACVYFYIHRLTA